MLTLFIPAIVSSTCPPKRKDRSHEEKDEKAITVRLRLFLNKNGTPGLYIN